jgi:hypothetical protein
MVVSLSRSVIWATKKPRLQGAAWREHGLSGARHRIRGAEQAMGRRGRANIMRRRMRQVGVAVNLLPFGQIDNAESFQRHGGGG